MTTAIQFSGGKDSLAVMYLMRDRLRDATVYFGDTGHVYPHMKEFVIKTCADLGATLKIITPPVSIEAYQAAYGMPSDIVPVEASAQMQQFQKDKRTHLVQSNLNCCASMLWIPMQNALIADGVTHVIRGSKASDGHVGVADRYQENGITYESPLWDWTDNDVFQYLREVSAELPEHYADVNNSFDCIFCTAFLTSDGALERLEWTRKRYPELWPTLRSRLQHVKSIIDTERAAIDDALTVGE